MLLFILLLLMCEHLKLHTHYYPKLSHIKPANTIQTFNYDIKWLGPRHQRPNRDINDFFSGKISMYQ